MVTPPSISTGSRTLVPVTPSSGAAADQMAISSPTTIQSLTAKQWVVPPRPKPGRKPATDTPPTKRKAQNRAAQRAFRERRAAKVGDLEEQMEEMQRIHESEKAALEAKAEEFRNAYENNDGLISQWQAYAQGQQDELNQLKKATVDLERECAVLKGQAVPIPRWGLKTTNPSPEQSGSLAVAAEQAYNTPEETLDGCVRCSLEKCQCLEDTLESMTEEMTDASKRQTGSNLDDFKPNKRVRIEIKHEAESEPSYVYASPKADPSSTHSSDVNSRLNPVRPAESCGFCQEGSSCPCAELAAEQERSYEDHGSRLPSPPSEDAIDFTTSSTGIAIRMGSSNAAPKRSCGNEPGSCNQCQTDSNSRKFCQGLAATRSAASVISAPPQAQPEPSTLPDNKIVPCAAGQACCRVSSVLSTIQSQPNISGQNNTNELDFTTSSHGIKGTTLSCAEAFKALSSHPEFAKASQDKASWLPMLTTKPASRGDTHDTQSPGPENPTESSSDASTNTMQIVNGTPRTAFEIEAASVMGVMKHFDRRYGRMFK